MHSGSKKIKVGNKRTIMEDEIIKQCLNLPEHFWVYSKGMEIYKDKVVSELTLNLMKGI